MRPIPGTIAVDGRHFLYLRFPNRQAFEDAFDSIPLESSPTKPTSGGVIAENVVIKPANTESFWGVSFKGDLLGWEGAIIHYCFVHGVGIARMNDSRLIVNDQLSYSLVDLEVVFY